MIHHEAWYREAVRPIRLDLQEVTRVTDQILEELVDTLDTYFSNPDKIVPSGKYLWAPNWGPRIKVQNVKGKSITIPITVRPDPYYRGLGFGGALTLQQPKVLVLTGTFGDLPSGAVRELFTNFRDKIYREIHSIISHELTHAKDIIPGVSYDSTQEQMDLEIYYNDPAEVRAYMQQVSQETLFNLPEEGDPEQNFSDFFMTGLSQSLTWQRIQEYLTPENRKKILQGVSHYVMDRGYGP